jgi:hypothetical protein
MVLVTLGLLRGRTSHRAPHPSTISRWAFKVGLHKLQTAPKKHSGWTAIVDLSIHVGSKRVLCLLRAEQARIDEGRPLTLADVEVVGLHVLERNTAEELRKLLEGDLLRVGFPDGIVTDGGSDIVLAVRSLNESLGTRIVHIEDISHLCARLLRKELGEEKQQLEAFSKELGSCAAQVRQTDLAYLAPPAMRTKARFMNLSKVATWASRVLCLLAEVRQGRVASKVLRSRRLFGWLRGFAPLVDKILICTTVLERVQRIVKHQGLCARSALEIKIEIATLGRASLIAKRLRGWVDRHLAFASRLGRPVLATSDIIESLFGRWKAVIGYHRSAELTTSVLLLPALCGALTPELVQEALRTIKVADLEAWKHREIGTTLRTKRTILRLVRPQRKRGVQKTAGNPFLSSA